MDDEVVPSAGLDIFLKTGREEEEMRIRRVFVEKLFGLFDHDIVMKMDDRITIIHAPNGFGKTAVLRMISGLFQGRYSDLRVFPFAVFGIEFDDGRMLKVETREPGKKGNDSKRSRRRKGDDQSLVFTFNGNSAFELPSVPERRQLHVPFEAVHQFAPELTQIGPEHWQTPEGDVLDVPQVINSHPKLGQFFGGEPLREPPWLKELRNSVDVRFIRSERLMARPPFEGTPSRERGPA